MVQERLYKRWPPLGSPASKIDPVRRLKDDRHPRLREVIFKWLGSAQSYFERRQRKSGVRGKKGPLLIGRHQSQILVTTFAAQIVTKHTEQRLHVSAIRDTNLALRFCKF